MVVFFNMLAQSGRTKFSPRNFLLSTIDLCGKGKEVSMPLDFKDRRTFDGLTDVIDNALDLADECGWRYALAFLISEQVPSEIIQRLLSGGARARLTSKDGNPTYQTDAYGWKGRNTEGMVDLFDSLRERRFEEPCAAKQTPFASRSSVNSDLDD